MNKYATYYRSFLHDKTDNVDVNKSPLGGDVVNVIFKFAQNYKLFDWWKDIKLSEHRRVQLDMRLAKRLGYR